MANEFIREEAKEYSVSMETASLVHALESYHSFYSELLETMERINGEENKEEEDKLFELMNPIREYLKEHLFQSIEDSLDQKANPLSPIRYRI